MVPLMPIMVPTGFSAANVRLTLKNRIKTAEETTLRLPNDLDKTSTEGIKTMIYHSKNENPQKPGFPKDYQI